MYTGTPAAQQNKIATLAQWAKPAASATSSISSRLPLIAAGVGALWLFGKKLFK